MNRTVIALPLPLRDVSMFSFDRKTSHPENLAGTLEKRMMIPKIASELRTDKKVEIFAYDW